MSWSLVYEGFEPAEEGLREALCTLGNGRFATRGALPEARADKVHYPGCYLAGGYNRATTRIKNREVVNEDLVNLPNWLPVTFRIEKGSWLAPGAFEILDHRIELDLKRGVLHRRSTVRDEAGRSTRIEQRRLVHMADPRLAALETRITAFDWSGRIEIRSGLDGEVENAGVARYRDLERRHLEVLEAEADDEGLFLRVRTTQSRLEVALAARTRLFRDDRPLEVERWTEVEGGRVAEEFALELREGEDVVVEKVVALSTSRDRAISEPGLAAREALAASGRFGPLLERHALAWEQLWRRADLEIEGERRIAMILRLHVFHLLATVSEHTTELDVGVPARGWTGEAYRGHVFWDELFMFPMLSLRLPEVARALLLYRWRRLPKAREAARDAGLRGAMYPWQSGSDGREETQQLHLNPKSGRWKPDNSHRQRHVGAAIAYNVWQYWQATCDREFLMCYGAEMLLEIARFWSSIATWDQARDRFEILGVMGPDEYHDSYPDSDEPGLDNNAYTNVMAAWVLCRALETLDLLPVERRRELEERLGLGAEEYQHWHEVSRKLVVPFHGDGIISQFEGFERLLPFDWDGYRERYGDIQRLDRILEAEDDTPNRYQVAKQADVLMLLYLFSAEELTALLARLGYDWDPARIPDNVRYYLARTSHGSTLSNVVHSWVLARTDRAHSLELFRRALESDIADIQGGTTAEGIHLGAMAGTVDLLQLGYTGLELRGDVLRFNPCLPDELNSLRLRLCYRHHRVEIRVTHAVLEVAVQRDGAEPLRVACRDEERAVAPGEGTVFELGTAGKVDA